jgi:hypothetical protein
MKQAPRHLMLRLVLPQGDLQLSRPQAQVLRQARELQQVQVSQQAQESQQAQQVLQQAQ